MRHICQTCKHARWGSQWEGVCEYPLPGLPKAKKYAHSHAIVYNSGVGCQEWELGQRCFTCANLDVVCTVVIDPDTLPVIAVVADSEVSAMCGVNCAWWVEGE